MLKRHFGSSLLERFGNFNSKHLPEIRLWFFLFILLLLFITYYKDACGIESEIYSSRRFVMQS